MAENIYERIHKTLSWKRIVGFNVVLFLLMVVPISLRLAQMDTENRSSAANEIAEPVVTPPPDYPAAPPKIDRVSMFFGKTGDTVVVLGANFGAYKWGSRVFVGNTEAADSQIVRWSNTILEVKIPEGARTGRVWVVINGVQANWEGSLLLYDVSRAAQIGLQKSGSGQARVFLSNAAGTKRGMIELGYVSEPVEVSGVGGVRVTAQTANADALGKKLAINFELDQPLPSNQTTILDIKYPGIGIIELVRVEIFDGGGNLMPLFANPLNVKILQ